MMKPHVLAAILLATALAGCVQDSGSAQESESPAASGSAAPTDASPSGNGTEPAPAPNAPPTANLTSDVVNGSVPLNVTFSLMGEDADGDNLSWSFDADGDGAADANGTDLPASFAFSYTEAGNYTAVLNVTDGKASAEANLTIRAEVALPAGPNICHRPTPATGPFYQHNEGGTWIFLERNGIPGLQVGNTHPTGPNGGGVGFANPAWATCVQGDQMLF